MITCIFWKNNIRTSLTNPGILRPFSPKIVWRAFVPFHTYMCVIVFLLNARLFLYLIKIRYDAGPSIRIHYAFLFQYCHTPHITLCSHWSAGRQNHGYRGKCYAQQTQRHFCNHHCLLKTRLILLLVYCRKIYIANLSCELLVHWGFTM